MSDSMIRVERKGPITIVTMDRAANHNSLDSRAQAEMAEAFDDFAADDDQWVAILTGAGEKAFCAGHDLRTPPPEGPHGLPASGFGGLTARKDFYKPVIAAVNGVAVGGGFEMALACDIVVTDPHARFALPEVKVGVTALGGGILRLPRVIGLQRAMGIMLTGRLVGAEEGASMGFVTEVAGSTGAMAAALQWADLLLTASPLAVQATKAVALECADEPLLDAMNRQWTLNPVVRAQNSEDAREGPMAFNERRAPQWQGR